MRGADRPELDGPIQSADKQGVRRAWSRRRREREGRQRAFRAGSEFVLAVVRLDVPNLDIACVIIGDHIGIKSGRVGGPSGECKRGRLPHGLPDRQALLRGQPLQDHTQRDEHGKRQLTRGSGDIGTARGAHLTPSRRPSKTRRTRTRRRPPGWASNRQTYICAALSFFSQTRHATCHGLALRARRSRQYVVVQ